MTPPATWRGPNADQTGLFNGTVRELDEMLYEFEEPFVVDSTKFQKAFGDHATPLSEAIPATVDWFRTHPKS